MKKIQTLIVVVTLLLLATNVKAIGGGGGNNPPWGGPTAPWCEFCYNESSGWWQWEGYNPYLSNSIPDTFERDVAIGAKGVQTCINLTLPLGCVADVTFQWLNATLYFDDWMDWVDEQNWDWDDWNVNWSTEPTWQNDSYWFNYSNWSLLSHSQQICAYNPNWTCRTENDWASGWDEWRVVLNVTCGSTYYNTTCYYCFQPELCPLSYIWPPSPNGTACPCCDHICIGINNEEGHNMNATIYGSYDGTNYFTWNKYFNITNGTYCFCMDDVYLERTPSKQGEWIGASGIQAAGVKVATMTKLGCSAAWEFSDNQEEEIQFNVRIPVRINLTLPVTLDFGWSSPATNKICNWNLSYDITAIDEDTATGCEYYDDILAESSLTANGLTMQRSYITEIADGDRCIHFNLERDGNDASDNLSDVAHLHGVCFSYYYCNDLIHIYNATSPMRYNTTYSWYANITDIETGESTETDIFSFTTVVDPNDCFCGNITTYLNETGIGAEKDYIIGLIGIIGILGLIGWFMGRKEE